MSKKNLDKLFEEKFKDFREVPDEKVWNAIEASLDQKRKKRAIPIWWKLGGAAAILALALMLWNPFSDGIANTSTVTDSENIDTENSTIEKDATQENTLPFPEIDTNAIVGGISDKTAAETENETVKDVEEKNAVANKKSSVVQTDTGTPDTQKSRQNSIVQLPKTNQEALANGTAQDEDTLQNTNSSNSSNNPNTRQTQITASEVELDGRIKTAEKSNSEKEVLQQQGGAANEAIALSPDTVADDAITERMTTNQGLLPKEKVALGPEATIGQNEETSSEVTEVDPEKKSIYEAIEEQNNEEVLAEASNGRWSAGPSIAPVYFNAIGEGSPVNSIFTQNSKSGHTNLSYGLSVAYAVNNKLRIRSGIHKVDYGYDTDEVEFSSSLQATSGTQIENIDYSSTAKNLVVKSEASSLSLASPESLANDASFELNTANTSARNGTMAQQFGYLEIPVELDYALIDRKFGVNLVGGISSLFLLDNSILLSSGELTTEIGEANNVNTVNFSTNVGFGVNYKFTPKIQLNVEPVFKYQLNTFSEVSGDFQPFSIGVYSGLNFKF